jgi:hypothetical protein
LGGRRVSIEIISQNTHAGSAFNEYGTIISFRIFCENNCSLEDKEVISNTNNASTINQAGSFCIESHKAIPVIAII